MFSLKTILFLCSSIGQIWKIVFTVECLTLTNTKLNQSTKHLTSFKLSKCASGYQKVCKYRQKDSNELFGGNTCWNFPSFHTPEAQKMVRNKCVKTNYLLFLQKIFNNLNLRILQVLNKIFDNFLFWITSFALEATMETQTKPKVIISAVSSHKLFWCI